MLVWVHPQSSLFVQGTDDTLKTKPSNKNIFFFLIKWYLSKLIKQCSMHYSNVLSLIYLETTIYFLYFIRLYARRFTGIYLNKMKYLKALSVVPYQSSCFGIPVVWLGIEPGLKYDTVYKHDQVFGGGFSFVSFY